MNVGAAQGVAVREFQTDSGPVDHTLFVDRTLSIEAKAEGTTLSGFSDQPDRDVAGAPDYLVREVGQVRFEYLASPTEILFRDHADRAPASRCVFAFHPGDACALAEGTRNAAPAPLGYAAPERRGFARLVRSGRLAASKVSWRRTIRAPSCKFRPRRRGRRKDQSL
jgi:hypothetical protein